VVQGGWGGVAKLTKKERAGLPDRAFAYVDSQGHRRLPIHDERTSGTRSPGSIASRSKTTPPRSGRADACWTPRRSTGSSRWGSWPARCASWGPVRAGSKGCRRDPSPSWKPRACMSLFGRLGVSTL